jgi:hypothetical protein
MPLELLDVFGNEARIESVWRDLSAVCEHSYFQSWGWIENWLANLPKTVSLKLAIVRAGNEPKPQAAFFLGHDTVVNQNVFRSRAFVLNQTGKWEFDRLYIEHNLILRRKDCGLTLREMLEMLPPDWEEFYLNALDRETFPGNDLADLPAPCELMIAKEMPCRYVDLDKVRQKSGDYLALLGSSVRSQVKRAYKLYEAQGRLATEVGDTLPAALSIYQELIELHNASWQKRNEAGAFATEYFREFHRTLIEKRLASGEIQLLRIKSGEKTIGCVYNFVFGGRVHFYQSGLAIEEDNRLKPGYVAHAEAVKLSAQAGHSVYDFLAGTEEYKQRLSTDERTMVWARIQKPRIKFKIERFVRHAAIAGQSRYHDWKRAQRTKVAAGQ